MLGSVGILFMGMLLWPGTEPPDISGKWTSDEWGTVELEQKEPGRYEGKLENGLFVFGKAPFDHKQWTEMACANCHKGPNDFAGKIELKWSRLENRFNGSWSIPEKHSGKISIRLVENEIRGGWTTSKKSDSYPGLARLGDLAWKRIQTTTGEKEKMDLDTIAAWAVNGIQPWNDVDERLLWLQKASTAATVDPLAFAVDRFNEEMRNKFPNHDQPPLTKEELIACASWNKLHRENSVAVSGLLSALEKRQQFLEKWTIHGDFVELPPKDTPVRAYQIVLKHNQSGERFTVRQRFIAPLKSLSKPDSQPGESKGIPLSAAIKRFNETNFRVDGQKQQPLTEEEVIAAILHQQTRRDEYDVSDALFERLLGIARTRVLPEGAALEVIPKFGNEGETIHTIWSVRVKLVQDEAGREGWTYAFILREQFLSVTHGDALKIHWGTPAANGLQMGVRVSPPLTRYSIGQRIDVELFYRNVLTKPLQATLSNLPSYTVVGQDNRGREITVVDPPFDLLGGASVVSLSEQPVARKGMSLKLVNSSVSQFSDEKLVLVEAGQTYRLRFETRSFSDGSNDSLLSGEIEFSVYESEDVRSTTPK